MKIPASLLRRVQWLNLPGAFLIALLQRTPVLRVAAVAEEAIVGSPVGALVRSAFAAAASLGAVHALAGATQFVVSPNPVNGTVGTNVSVGITVTGAQTPAGSFRIVSGTLPPGLALLNATSSGYANGSTAVISGTPTTSGNYTVFVRAWEFANGSGDSFPATAGQQISFNITGGTSNSAPSITSQPRSITTAAGGGAIFSVTATGTPAPTYQWSKNGSPLSGQTGSSLTLSSVQASDAGSYTVVVSNSAGSVTSSPAVLTVSGGTSGAPTFTTQPASATVATGGTVVFNASATGATSYSWQRNGTDVGATGPILVVSNASSANAGTYTAIATNSAGSTTSTAATLTVTSVTPAQTGHLSNLSVRTNSGSGDQVLNVGFAVGGAGTSGAKPLLIRVTGPALAGFGVSGTMVDPTLTVLPLGSSTTVASNDNWGGNANVAAMTTAVGAFPLTDTTSFDAAVATSVSAGSYTALAAGKNNGTGVVLTEIYDGTASGNFSSTTPRLVNVSARAQVATGDGALIAGFVIGGSTAKTLLIRATGPALAAFGVSGTLADPTLDLFPLGSTTSIASNDNWGGSSVIANVAASVGAFPISDPNSKDAVMLVTLPAGAYTAQVKGVNGGTGVALIEVYEVP